MLRISAVNDFVPAANKLEAVSRLSALTGAEPERLGPGSKERKSVLVNLATGLAIDIDPSADKIRVGQQLATALGVAWTDDCWSAGHTITLVGLNRLLSGAHREVSRRRDLATTARSQRPQARGKLEAVTRISALVGGGVELLGPGSKERKSVLVSVVNGLSLDVDVSMPKPELAAAIVRALGASWDSSCWSAGQTITLEGLNRILVALPVEASVGRTREGPFPSVTSEAEGLLSALAAVLPAYMDGRRCVTQMIEAEDRHWAQDEWRGFYFEFVGLPALINAFAGGPVKFGNTTFDYGLGDVWDLKVHGSDSPTAILNAVDAVESCLDRRGLGFLILTGDTDFDDGEFRHWQAETRVTQGRPARPRKTPAKYVRRSKRGFTPLRLEAVHLADRSDLGRALDCGAVKVMKQGRQTSGEARKPKYTIDLAGARDAGLIVAEADLGEATRRVDLV